MHPTWIIDGIAFGLIALAISRSYRSWKMLYQIGPPVKVSYRKNFFEFQRRRNAISDSVVRAQLRRVDLVAGAAWISGFALLVFRHFSQVFSR